MDDWNTEMHPLVAARYAVGLMQVEVAESSGVALRTLRRYEHGQTIPSRLQLKALAGTLQIPPEELQDRLARWQARISKLRRTG